LIFFVGTIRSDVSPVYRVSQASGRLHDRSSAHAVED
jgi:hypothetical protein